MLVYLYLLCCTSFFHLSLQHMGVFLRKILSITLLKFQVLCSKVVLNSEVLYINAVLADRSRRFTEFLYFWICDAALDHSVSPFIQSYSPQM